MQRTSAVRAGEGGGEEAWGWSGGFTVGSESQTQSDRTKRFQRGARGRRNIPRVHYLKWTAGPETADDSGVTRARRLSSVMLAHARHLAATGAGLYLLQGLRDTGVNYSKRGVGGVKGHSETRYEESWRILERLQAELMLETLLCPGLSAPLADLH